MLKSQTPKAETMGLFFLFLLLGSLNVTAQTKKEEHHLWGQIVEYFSRTKLHDRFVCELMLPDSTVIAVDTSHINNEREQEMIFHFVVDGGHDNYLIRISNPDYA